MQNKFIPASVLEQLRKEVDLLALIRERVRLIQNGNEWRGQCPFHAARRRPPFRVLPEKKLFRCMGCGEEGDAIDFVMATGKCSFREAVAILSARFLPPVDPVLQALDEAARFYERTLWEHPAAQAAREHLEQRGIREETARAWRLGYALPGWANLFEALQHSGITTQALESAGLLVPRASGRGHYDRFRARLMIPIRRERQVIAFGGRLSGDSDEPKYLNSPDTTHFQKGATLFALDESAAAVAAGAPAVVVEGYFDAIALHQAGISSAVAVCGSTASEKHLAALAAAGTRELCFAFDGDEAGIAAATRAAVLGLRSACRITVLQCPQGLDPDELVQRDGADGVRMRVTRAMPASDFLIEQEFRKLAASPAIEESIGALSRVASQFESSGASFSARQIHRLSQLVGCSAASIEAFLARQGLVA